MRGTYSDQEDRKSSSNDQRESNGEDLVRVYGGLAEDVVNMGLLAVAHWGWDSGRRLVGILLDVNVEGVGNEALGGAKGADDDSRVDGFRRHEQLGWDLLLGL